MFTGGTIWILTHTQLKKPQAENRPSTMAHGQNEETAADGNGAMRPSTLARRSLARVGPTDARTEDTANVLWALGRLEDEELFAELLPRAEAQVEQMEPQADGMSGAVGGGGWGGGNTWMVHAT